jgi:hypothetical protein
MEAPMKRVVFVVVLSLSVSGSALAQNKKTPTSSPSKAAPTQRIDIEADTVEGDLFKPMTDVTTTRPNTKSPKLIKIRDNFHAEMIKSVHEL